MTSPRVRLEKITGQNHDAVCALRVHPAQELFVSSVAQSLHEAAATPEAEPWYRAIYSGDEPVGFVMLGWNVSPGRPGLIGPYFLWKLLIGQHHQRRGFGREALTQIIDLVRADGGTELLTSYQPGDGEPWPFYQEFGFQPTGEIHDGEIILRLELSSRWACAHKLRSLLPPAGAQKPTPLLIVRSSALCG